MDPLRILLACILLLTCAAAVHILISFQHTYKRRRSAHTSSLAQRRAAHAAPDAPPAPSYRLLCFLGSGGHTAEILKMVEDTLQSPSPPGHISYVASSTDDHSLDKARRLHGDLRPKAGASYGAVPRAREVHEPLLSSAVSTLRCLAGAVPVVRRARPDVVLVNGPGSSVVVVFVALALNALGRSRSRVVYVESVARTRTLSLSAKILYYFVHRFIVQWPELAEDRPLAESYGRLC